MRKKWKGEGEGGQGQRHRESTVNFKNSIYKISLVDSFCDSVLLFYETLPMTSQTLM